MEKAQAIHIRNILLKATFHLTSRKTGEKKEFKPMIHICCDNSLNISWVPDPEDENDLNSGNVVWDDENEVFYWFRSNTPTTIPMSPSSGMSFGNSPSWAGAVIAVDLGEIQNFRVILNEEAYYNLCSAINENGEIITKKQIEHNYIKIFEEADQYAVITRKKEVNYNTGLPKKYDPRYTEDSAYVITNHSDQGGGV